MANPLRLPMVPRALRNVVSRPATRRYPYEIRPRFEGARGKIEFDVQTCNYCMLCMRRCPAAAITVNREEKTWSIEHLTCIACNACVEVCAKKSLTMSKESRAVQLPTGIAGRRPGHEQHSPAEIPCPEPAGAASAS